MNFMDKIKQDAKSKADRIRKVKAAVIKATNHEWAEKAIEQLIDAYDKEFGQAIRDVEEIQTALDEQKRQATISYLLDRMPLDTLDEAINTRKAAINE